jgi:folylpolyglutamate synthase/dihydropteroate synthase
MENKSIPQATSPLAAWLSYLENLHSKTIDMGLERVSQVAARLDVLKPAPFVFTVAGTNGKGTTCRTLESVLMAAGLQGWRLQLSTSGTLHRARSRAEQRAAGIGAYGVVRGN